MPAYTPTLADVQFLYQVNGTGRPFGVFRHDRRYRAKVIRQINLGQYPTEHAAAVQVVKWYRERYGEEWRHVVASRHVNPVRYQPRKRGGFYVWVWFHGEPVRVTERCGGQVVSYYPTLEMAKRALSRWLTNEFGIFAIIAPIFLYRLSSKFPLNDR